MDVQLSVSLTLLGLSLRVIAGIVSQSKVQLSGRAPAHNARALGLIPSTLNSVLKSSFIGMSVLGPCP